MRRGSIEQVIYLVVQRVAVGKLWEGVVVRIGQNGHGHIVTAHDVKLIDRRRNPDLNAGFSQLDAPAHRRHHSGHGSRHRDRLDQFCLGKAPNDRTNECR